MQRVLTVLMATLFVPGWLHGQTPSPATSATDLFYEALHVEEVQGDLHAAIAMYRQLPDRFPAARSIAARALVRMGHAYEKLGSPEASAAYERVVRDYIELWQDYCEADLGRFAIRSRLLMPSSAQRIHQSITGCLAPVFSGTVTPVPVAQGRWEEAPFQAVEGWHQRTRIRQERGR